MHAPTEAYGTGSGPAEDGPAGHTDTSAPGAGDDTGGADTAPEPGSASPAPGTGHGGTAEEQYARRRASGEAADAEASAQGPAGPVTRTTLPAEGPLTTEELDRYADELHELLDQYVAAAERQLFDLRTVAADDTRILGALGDGGLLPPGPDVLATVEYLGEHGVPALPGWRYLAQAVDPADHAAVLAARPELVDGVVITDPASHARAREVLTGAALLPRSAVAVGTAAALLAPVPGPGTGQDDGTGVFLVPPNPAMHDEHAADEERQALRARAAARDEEIRALAGARSSSPRAATTRTATWFPAPTTR
ncbi:hypothetical protein AB0M96_38415, partial [Streptomyces sp. NPDC051098]